MPDPTTAPVTRAAAAAAAANEGDLGRSIGVSPTWRTGGRGAELLPGGRQAFAFGARGEREAGVATRGAEEVEARRWEELAGAREEGGVVRRW